VSRLGRHQGHRVLRRGDPHEEGRHQDHRSGRGWRRPAVGGKSPPGPGPRAAAAGCARPRASAVLPRYGRPGRRSSVRPHSGPATQAPARQAPRTSSRAHRRRCPRAQRTRQAGRQRLLGVLRRAYPAGAGWAAGSPAAEGWACLLSETPHHEAGGDGRRPCGPGRRHPSLGRRRHGPGRVPL
jgi:hypothetical protein